MEISLRINGVQADTNDVPIKISSTPANLLTGEAGKTSYSASIKLPRTPTNDNIFREFISPWAFRRSKRYTASVWVGGLPLQSQFVALPTVTPDAISLNLVDISDRITSRTQTIYEYPNAFRRNAYSEWAVPLSDLFINDFGCRKPVFPQSIEIEPDQNKLAVVTPNKLVNWRTDIDGKKFRFVFKGGYDTVDGANYPDHRIVFDDPIANIYMRDFVSGASACSLRLDYASPEGGSFNYMVLDIDKSKVPPASWIDLTAVGLDDSYTLATRYRPNFSAWVPEGCTRFDAGGGITVPVGTKWFVLTNTIGSTYKTLRPSKLLSTSEGFYTDLVGRCVGDAQGSCPVPTPIGVTSSVTLLKDVCTSFMLFAGQTGTGQVYIEDSLGTVGDFSTVGKILSVDSITELGYVANVLTARLAKSLEQKVQISHFLSKANAEVLVSGIPYAPNEIEARNTTPWTARTLKPPYSDYPPTDILASEQIRRAVTKYLAPYSTGFEYTVSAEIPFINFASINFNVVYFVEQIKSNVIISGIENYDPSNGTCKLKLSRYDRSSSSVPQ